MFKVGENAVHLSHGVGVVVGIETRTFSEVKGPVKFYILEIHDNGAPKKVFVPVEGSETRLRRIVKTADAERIKRILTGAEPVADEFEHQTWNRRYREYMEKIHSGDATETAKVARALLKLRVTQDLSFGERKLLDHALQLICEECKLAGVELESTLAKVWG